MAEAIYEKFAPVLQSLDRNILFVASTLESNLNLTSGIFDIQNRQIDAIDKDETVKYTSAMGSILGESLAINKGIYDTQVKLLSITETMSKEKPKDSKFSLSGFFSAINPFGSANIKATEALETKLNEIAITLGSILGVSRSILGNQYAMMGIDREALEDEQRAADLEELNRNEQSPTPVVEDDEKKEPELKDDGELGIGDILKALALAPFALRFAKGFISSITDGLVEATAAGITGLAALIRNPINNAFTRIANATSRFAKMLTTVGNFISKTFGLLPGAGVLKSIVGRLAWPITFLFAAFDAIGAFMNTEGDLIDKIGAGLGAFTASIVGGILDLLKGIVAWIANKLGFENFANALGEFSFSDMIFEAITGAIGWIKTIFTDPVAALQQAWAGLVGDGGLIDILYAPIDKAIAWVQGIFGWGDPEEPFELSEVVKNAFRLAKDWVVGLFTWGEEAGTGEDGEWSLMNLVDAAVEKIKEFFTNLFDFLPSLDVVKNTLKSLLPSWLGGSDGEEDVAAARADLESQIEDLRNEQSSAPTTEQANQMMEFSGKTQEEYDADIRRLEEALAALPQANQGGIINAPESGTPVMLHGQEAIVPLDSPNAANIIRDAAGVTTLERKTVSLEQGSMAMSGQPQSVVISGGNSARGGDTYNNGGNTTTTTIINQSSDPVRALRHMPT